MRSVFTNRRPSYSENTVRSASATNMRADLRCSTSSDYSCTAAKNKVRWASLLFRRTVGVERTAILIRETVDPVKFRKLLKTLFFSLAFDVYYRA